MNWKQMVRLLLIFLMPIALSAFEAKPVTPYPVVGYQELSWYDTHSDSDRKLLVWYPVEQEVNGTPSNNPWDLFNVAVNSEPAKSRYKRPAVILSHGNMGNPHQLSWLIKGLVEADYVVLAVQHRDSIEGVENVNYWERPQDISRVIDVITLGPLKEMINVDQIGVSGFSLGGTTALWLVGARSTNLNILLPGHEYANPSDWEHLTEELPNMNTNMMQRSWKDPRVKAAFVMAPAWAWIFDVNSLKQVTTPTYILAPAGDEMLVTYNNAGFFGRNIPKAVYREIPGKAGHYIFVTKPDDEKREIIDPADRRYYLFQDDPSVDREWIQSQVVNDAIGFFNFVFKLADY